MRNHWVVRNDLNRLARRVAEVESEIATNGPGPDDKLADKLSRLRLLRNNVMRGEADRLRESGEASSQRDCIRIIQKRLEGVTSGWDVWYAITPNPDESIHYWNSEAEYLAWEEEQEAERLGIDLYPTPKKRPWWKRLP